jgi:hypothetical protein
VIGLEKFKEHHLIQLLTVLMLLEIVFKTHFLLHPDLNANNYFYAPKKIWRVYTLATLSDIPAAQGTNNYLPKYLNGGYVDSSILENIATFL